MVSHFLTILLVPFMSLAATQGADDMTLIDNMQKPAASAEKSPEAREIGARLDQFYKDCGRYPTTEEGLRALRVKPKSLDCPKWKASLEPFSKRWSYTSEGKDTYRLDPKI